MSHVAFLIPGLNKLAGAERQVLLLARGFRRRGWRVTVIALSGSGSQATAELNGNGISFLSLNMRKGLADPGGWSRFRRWLRHYRPDIVHTHLPHATWLARWSRLAAPIPFLIDTIHTSATGGLGRRLGYRLSGWLSDSVTAVSEAAADAYLQARMVDPRKLQVLHNGIDVEKWRTDGTARAAARRAFGLSNEFVWLAAGRLDPVKDYPTMLKATARLPQPVCLLVAGKGGLEADLKRQCASLGISSRVRFLGFQEDLWRSMQAADAFVLSSLWEGLPIALLEAAACELPAVATDVPGTREAVIPGQTAFLAPPDTPEALARAMTELMALPAEQRRSMGERGRRHILDHFNIEGVLKRWEQLYLGGPEASSPPASFASESE